MKGRMKMSQSYRVKTDVFEGPLDLLLHLINRYEIDIYDIPVAEITEQYMRYIHAMEQLELTIASEYLVMASTLLAIKSKMLLPQQKIDEEIDAYEEDPREELVRRLIEYRKFKEAALHLEEKEINAKRIYMREPLLLENKKNRFVLEKGAVTIYDMMDALHVMFERKKWNEPLETTVERVEIPIEQRMDEIIASLKKTQSGVKFSELFPHPSRTQIVTTFIAILELMKNNQIYCKQENPFEEIIIFYARHH